jgi:hypothetical protein
MNDDRTAPNVKALFDEYPLHDNDAKRISEETGYRLGTVRNWLRGRIKPNKRAFDLIVNEYVRPRYPACDPELIEVARSECTDRAMTPGLTRNGHEEWSGRVAPGAVQAPALPTAHHALHSYAVIAALLTDAVNARALTLMQRMELIRLMATTGETS